ncbi:hypothetical protein TNCV_643801 [Trichonephila clavipes]|nr:hypothetical protein TNCV_643801 [Trichonephila clavipes]
MLTVVAMGSFEQLVASEPKEIFEIKITPNFNPYGTSSPTRKQDVSLVFVKRSFRNDTKRKSPALELERRALVGTNWKSALDGKNLRRALKKGT